MDTNSENVRSQDLKNCLKSTAFCKTQPMLRFQKNKFKTWKLLCKQLFIPNQHGWQLNKLTHVTSVISWAENFSIKLGDAPGFLHSAVKFTSNQFLNFSAWKISILLLHCYTLYKNSWKKCWMLVNFNCFSESLRAECWNSNTRRNCRRFSFFCKKCFEFLVCFWWESSLQRSCCQCLSCCNKNASIYK